MWEVCSLASVGWVGNIKVDREVGTCVVRGTGRQGRLQKLIDFYSIIDF